MKFKRVLGQFRRAWSILRVHGWRKFVTSSMAWMRWRSGALTTGQIAYIDRKTQADVAFDTKLGVTTGGVQYLYDLNIDSQNARFGTNHTASDPVDFETAMGRIDIDISSATFIDLGSGRGRALIMAAMLPFRKIIGVEFARELHEESISNLQRVAPVAGDPERVTHILGDATEFDFPNEPLVLYLYNPFDAPIVGAVARKAMASWKEHPRCIRVAYLNPVFGGEWRNAGWEVVEERPAWAIFAPSSR